MLDKRVIVSVYFIPILDKLTLGITTSPILGCILIHQFFFCCLPQRLLKIQVFIPEADNHLLKFTLSVLILSGNLFQMARLGLVKLSHALLVSCLQYLVLLSCSLQLTCFLG